MKTVRIVLLVIIVLLLIAGLYALLRTQSTATTGGQPALTPVETATQPGPTEGRP